MDPRNVFMDRPASHDSRPTCFFSKAACRDCGLFRGRHYFLCHPGAARVAAGLPGEHVAPGEAAGGRALAPWHAGLLATFPDTGRSGMPGVR